MEEIRPPTWLPARFDHRFLAVITFGGMATDNAGCAVLGLGNGNGIRPGAKGYLGADMFGLGADMGVMAGHTITPLLHIDMEVMEVVFTVPEVGEGLGEFLLGDILIMTTETEFIILRPVLLIKFGGEILGKYPAVIGAMDIMAGHTITCLHRTMTEITARHLVGQLIVTGETEFLGILLQHGFDI